MHYPNDMLGLLIDHDAFRVSRFLPLSQFVTFCRDRGVNAPRERLRQLERVGVLLPMLRSYSPDVISKIETVEGGWRDLGPLEEGESRDGETRTELAQFDPTTRWAAIWRDEQLLWSPGQGEWSHAATMDTEADRHIAYYSPYQMFALSRAVTMLTMRVELEWAALPDGSPNTKFSPALRKRTAEFGYRAVSALRGFQHCDILAALCQLLANRFYYKTQSDGRRLTIGQFHDWEWGAYARSWSAEPVLQAFELDARTLKEAYETLDLAWWTLDPIARWWGLAQFVSMDKRRQLKGDALHASTLREMAQMLRLFHKEAFGTDLRPLGETGVQILHRVPDIAPDSDPLRALELTANQFGVNPKPQLVLLVEGETEARIIPALFERMFGAGTARYGIEVVSLNGVGSADGGKGARSSALWRLVDYLHHHQTLAFVLLDNEGYAARNVGQGLPLTNSVHSRHRRATRADHVRIWHRNFEFDNFSDTELAAALNAMAADRMFTRSDVAQCRAAAAERPMKGRPLPSLARLYAERTGAPLDKPGLGLRLIDAIFDPTSRRKPDNRPIVKFLIRVANKASRNHQPHTLATWEANQRSGYVGTLLPEARRTQRRERAQRRRARRP